MSFIKNPARSRPLSANVKRLMKMARESPQNPDVEKIEREFTARDLAYCDMQGNIFMAAVDQDIPMDYFAPTFMNSQLAGVIDYSFSRAGGMEEDDISNYLRMPILLKSPSVIVDTVMWLDHIVTELNPGESANMAVVNALESNAEQKPKHPDPPTEKELQAWIAEYEYAYWLGYIYRCECHMHDRGKQNGYEQRGWPDVEKQALDRIEIQAIRELVKSTNPRYWEVFYQIKMYGEDAKAVADRMGVSVQRIHQLMNKVTEIAKNYRKENQ